MRKPTAGERFEGFADAEARFFRALAKNQTRDWFLAHKAEYETGWATPMKLLLSEARERIDAFFPHVDLVDEPKVFRIFRDVRFSKDKTPYKTHASGILQVQRAGKVTEVPAALYVQIGAEETFAGAGHYMMDAAQLARFRAAVADDTSGKDLVAMVKKLERGGYRVDSAEVLKKVPRGFDAEHPRADLLRRKGLVVSYPELPGELIATRGLLDWLVAATKPVAPLVEWLTFATV